MLHPTTVQAKEKELAAQQGKEQIAAGSNGLADLGIFKPMIVNQLEYKMNTGFKGFLRPKWYPYPFGLWVPKTNLPTRRRAS